MSANPMPTPPPPPPAAFPVAPASQPAPGYAYPQPALKSPGTAGVLSLLPGLGHVYLGLYQRAVAFFAIWVVLLTIVTEGHRTGALGVFIPFWWFFVLIDAVRQAKAINLTGAPEANLVTGEKAIPVSGSLGFGVFLMLVGLFFLVERFVDIDLRFLLDWWPLLLVGFGGWQVYGHFKARAAAEKPPSDF